MAEGSRTEESTLDIQSHTQSPDTSLLKTPTRRVSCVHLEGFHNIEPYLNLQLVEAQELFLFAKANEL